MPLDNPTLIDLSGAANSSTTQPGYMPTLSGSATDVFKGDGSQGPVNDPTKGLFLFNHFMASNGYASPWAGVAVGTGGTHTPGTASATHPGVDALECGTSTGGGYKHMTSAQQVLLAGHESAQLIFEVDVTAGTTAYFGFHNATSATAPTYGVYMTIAETTIDGHAATNSTRTDTGTTYTFTQGVWYRAKIVLDATAARADFYLYTCTNGTLVWTNNVQANIPTAYAIGNGILMTSTATSVTPTLSVDYMDLRIDRPLSG